MTNLFCENYVSLTNVLTGQKFRKEGGWGVVAKVFKKRMSVILTFFVI